MKPRRKTLVATLVFLVILLIPTLAFAADVDDQGAFGEALAKGGIPLALGASFVVGLLMAATPCVFPMIPITVSIFGATEAKSRGRAVMLSATFLLGMVCFFATLGIISGVTGSEVSTFMNKWYARVGVAVIFGALAASMFGAFEIALPASLQNRLSSVGGVGFRGAFVIGLFMAVIAAPCTTGFLFGMAEEVSHLKDPVLGGAAFSALALGMGAPFFLVGAFAMSMPKPGAWMMGVKWVSGVALSYMAIKYLVDAFPKVFGNLAQPGTTYGVVAIGLCAIGLGLAAVHIAGERRRSPVKHLSKPMKLASILPAVVGVFMFLGWMGAKKPEIVPDAIASEHAPTDGTAATVGSKAPKPIAWQTDYDKALSEAKESHKPILVDFGATWCTSCKELEEETFPDPKVRAEAARFVGLKVDATDDDDAKVQAIGQKYKLNLGQLPLIVLLDSEGNIAQQLHGFVKPEKLVTAMQSVQ